MTGEGLGEVILGNCIIKFANNPNTSIDPRNMYSLKATSIFTKDTCWDFYSSTVFKETIKPTAIQMAIYDVFIERIWFSNKMNVLLSCVILWMKLTDKM